MCIIQGEQATLANVETASGANKDTNWTFAGGQARQGGVGVHVGHRVLVGGHPVRVWGPGGRVSEATEEAGWAAVGKL